MVGLSRSFVFLSLVLAVALFVAVNDAVDRSKFRTCDSTSFCRRHRELTRWATFRVNPSTIAASSTGLTAEVIRTDNEPSEKSQPVVFTLELIVYEHGILRLKLNEKNPLKPRYEVPDVLLSQLQTAEGTYKDHKLSFGPSSAFSAVISDDPFRLDVFVGNEKVISFNDRNLLQFEELQERQAAAPEPAAVEDEEATEEEAKQPEEAAPVAKRDEEGAWSESFGTHQYAQAPCNSFRDLRCAAYTQSAPRASPGIPSLAVPSHWARTSPLSAPLPCTAFPSTPPPSP